MCVFTNNMTYTCFTNSGTASGICTSVHFICGFIVTKYFQSLTELIGIGGTFWIFAIVSAVGIVFVFFCVPETKLKTLEEIQCEADAADVSPLLRTSINKPELSSSTQYNTFPIDTDTDAEAG